jgi:hypothetical protein
VSGEPARKPPAGADVVTGIVMEGRTTPQGLEMLRLELRRLAKRYGAELTTFRVERPDEIDLLT